MAEIKDVVKLAVDSYKGRVEKYSVGQSQDVLRQALIDANGGSTKLDYKAIRDGKCNGLFTLVEEILSRTVALGDKNVFIVEDNTLFVVDDVAEGNQGIRRQRLGGKSEVSIPTSMHAIRIYEELNRVLSGRVDFNVFIDKVAKSFSQKILNDIYTLWAGATAADLGGVAYFPTAGTYNEDNLLDVISHVEAAAGGKTATIVGTKKALRNLKESIMSDGAKDEFHNMGYAGTFFGTPVVAIPQRHQVGSTNFVFQDDVLTIVAGDDKPIKFVYEGDPLVIMGDPKTNADLTQELTFMHVA